MRNGTACDWCGRKFQKGTRRLSYSYVNGAEVSYHIDCAKKVGGKNDLGRHEDSCPLATSLYGTCTCGGEQ